MSIAFDLLRAANKAKPAPNGRCYVCDAPFQQPRTWTRQLHGYDPYTDKPMVSDTEESPADAWNFGGHEVCRDCYADLEKWAEENAK